MDRFNGKMRAPGSFSAAVLSSAPSREDLGSEQRACEAHGPYDAHGVRYFGRTVVWTECPGCVAKAAAESDAREAERLARAQKERLADMLQRSAIPPRFVGRTFDVYAVASPGQQQALDVARHYAEQFEQRARRGQGLIFSGPPGTGKSHLAVGILQALLPRHVGLYTTLMGVVRMLRATWQRGADNTESEVLSMLASVPLLVVDEVGVQYGTDAERTQFFEVLDARYLGMMPTILITNQDKDGLRATVGERAFDRLTETARWVVFDWPSHRPQVRKAAA